MKTDCVSVHASVHSNSNALFSATAGPILTKVGVWMDTPCESIILKNQDNQGAQRRVIALKLGNVGPRCKVLGFPLDLPLGRDRDAQYIFKLN